jgi:hypothetical protein
LKDLLFVVDKIRSAKATFTSLTEHLDTKGPAGEALMQMLGVFAQFERSMISERTKLGVRQAIAGGAVVGRPSALDPAQKKHLKFYTALILGALKGWSKEYLLSHDFYQGSLVPEIAEIAAGSYREKNPPQIVGGGYVVKSLEAALWAFYRSSTFERGALLLGNCSNDGPIRKTEAVYFSQSERLIAGTRCLQA